MVRVQLPVKCPSCKLENPPDAARCDCGFVFSVATAEPSGTRAVQPTDPTIVFHLQSIDNSVRTIKRIVVWWAVLTVIALLILFFRR